MAKEVPAGFYDDGQGRKRFYDGKQWTDEYEGVEAGVVPAPVVDPSILWSAVGKPITGLGAGRYKLTAEMLSFETGTLSLKAQHILTHEIHDVDVSQTMIQKARGVGTITLFAVRTTGREQVIIEDVEEFRVGAQKLNEVALAARDRRLTRETTSTVNYVGQHPGATQAAAPAATAAAAPTFDLNAELSKLAAFREQGILDDDEFKAAKAKLLGL